MVKKRTRAEKKAFVAGMCVATAWAVTVVVWSAKKRTMGPITWTPAAEVCSCVH